MISGHQFERVFFFAQLIRSVRLLGRSTNNGFDTKHRRYLIAEFACPIFVPDDLSEAEQKQPRLCQQVATSPPRLDLKLAISLGGDGP